MSCMSKQVATAYSLPEYIFMIGGPGAEKGTQCSLLPKKYGFWHFSLGNILRAKASIPKSKWGDVIRRNIQEGVVGSKEMTVELLKIAVNSLLAICNPQFLLVDGFPRSSDRAQFFEQEVAVQLCVLLLKFPTTSCDSGCTATPRVEAALITTTKPLTRESRSYTTKTLHRYSTTVLRGGKLVNVDASLSQREVLANIELGLGRYLRLVPSSGVDPEHSETVTRKRKGIASE